MTYGWLCPATSRRGRQQAECIWMERAEPSPGPSCALSGMSCLLLILDGGKRNFTCSVPPVSRASILSSALVAFARASLTGIRAMCHWGSSHFWREQGVDVQPPIGEVTRNHACTARSAAAGRAGRTAGRGARPGGCFLVPKRRAVALAVQELERSWNFPRALQELSSEPSENIF